MANVEMYSTAVCPYCIRAEQLLARKGAEVNKIYIDRDAEQFKEMIQRAKGSRSVPQIFINDIHVGGYDDLVELDMDGKLVPMLEK